MWRERQKWRGIPEMGRGVSHTDGSGLSRNLREIAHRRRRTRRVKGVGAGGKCRALPRGVINSISKLHTAYETSQTLNLKLLGLLIDDVYHCICYRLRLDEACHAHSWFVFVFFFFETEGVSAAAAARHDPYTRAEHRRCRPSALETAARDPSRINLSLSLSLLCALPQIAGKAAAVCATHPHARERSTGDIGHLLSAV